MTPKIYNGRRLLGNMIMNPEMKNLQETRFELVFIKVNDKTVQWFSGQDIFCKRGWFQSHQLQKKMLHEKNNQCSLSGTLLPRVLRVI